MIKVLDKPCLDLTTLIGRSFIAFLSALVGDECQRIVKRANDARAAVRKWRIAIPKVVWGGSMDWRPLGHLMYRNRYHGLALAGNMPGFDR